MTGIGSEKNIKGQKREGVTRTPSESHMERNSAQFTSKPEQPGRE